MFRIFIITGLFTLLMACTPKPKAILYGEDKCKFCMMTIVDGKFASEAVTSTGKAYKFDAIECMVNFIRREENKTYAFLQVCDFKTPQKMLDAKKSQFLFSKAIPSPMGAFLSAYENDTHAYAAQQEKGGTLMDWEALKQHVSTESIQKDYSAK